MKFFKNYCIPCTLLIIGVIILLNVLLSGNAWQRTETSTTVLDLAIADGQAYVLYDGIVYRYNQEGAWEALEYNEMMKQIFSGDHFCALGESGKLYYEMEQSLSDLLKKGNVPLGSAAIMSRTEEALAINEEQKFVLINHNVGDRDFRAMLSDASLIFHNGELYEKYKLDEKTTMLSGSYILSPSGNVYMLHLNVDTVPYTPELKKVYEEGDIVLIDAIDAGGDHGIGLTAKGKTVILSSGFWYDGPDWNQLVKVVQGDCFVAGLTKDGMVLFKHYDVDKTAEIQAEISNWTDIVAIEDYYQSLYGIDKSGNIVSVEW